MPLQQRSCGGHQAVGVRLLMIMNGIGVVISVGAHEKMMRMKMRAGEKVQKRQKNRKGGQPEG